MVEDFDNLFASNVRCPFYDKTHGQVFREET